MEISNNKRKAMMCSLFNQNIATTSLLEKCMLQRLPREGVCSLIEGDQLDGKIIAGQR